MNEMITNRTTTRQPVSLPEAAYCIAVCRSRRTSHTTEASSASAHVTGKRASRYRTSATKKGRGLSSSKGNTNHSGKLRGPKLAERNIAVIESGSHHGDRNHWFPKGKLGLS